MIRATCLVLTCQPTLRSSVVPRHSRLKDEAQPFVMHLLSPFTGLVEIASEGPALASVPPPTSLRRFSKPHTASRDRQGRATSGPCDSLQHESNLSRDSGDLRWVQPRKGPGDQRGGILAAPSILMTSPLR